VGSSRITSSGRATSATASPADAGPGLRILARSAEQHHLAGVGPDQREQHLDHAGLAGAVGAEQPDDLAAADGEGDTVDRGLLAVPFAQARAPYGRGRD
jgi:hypothetical protein